MSDEEETARINWVQVVAGALAAVSSAVLLSTLGVAGTVIGAAMGSVIASVASAWYGRGIDASRQQVAAQAAALRRVGAARSRLDDAVSAVQRGDSGAQTGLLRADHELDEAEQALERASHLDGHDAEPTEAEQGRQGGSDESAGQDPQDAAEAARTLPWKRIALIAAGLFVAVMVAITAFELATGRAVSTFTGGSDKGTGSTVPGVQKAPEEASSTPEDRAPEEDPAATGPSDEASATDEPTEQPSPTVTPSSEPSATVSPTATPTAEPTDGLDPEPSPTEGGSID